jgi:outer membrane protein assembly factor BamE (lipoprotein component of BamABCDE complex)
MNIKIRSCMGEIKIMAVLGCGVLLYGGSIYQAVHAPSPVEYKKVQVGTTRTETISILGYPKMTDNKGNQKVDTFEFVDGYQAASKARIILYLAGDVFTIGLAELIFWPLEANVFDGKQCRGTVSYNADEHVTSYDILDSKGVPLWTPTIASSPTNAQKINNLESE